MSNNADSRMSPVSRVTDVVDSVKAYAVQETIGPARGAARWLAFGSLGAVFLGVGTVFFALAALRLVQDLGGESLSGGWSFVPHLVAATVLGVLSGVAMSRVHRTSLGRGA